VRSKHICTAQKNLMPQCTAMGSSKLSTASNLSYSSKQSVPHTRGPATAKLLSPRVVRVRGTASVVSGDDDDHARRRVECRRTLSAVSRRFDLRGAANTQQLWRQNFCRDLAGGTLFQSSCVIPTSPTGLFRRQLKGHLFRRCVTSDMQKR